MTDPAGPLEEFDLPLSSTAVTAEPDGFGESPFESRPAPESVEFPEGMGDDPAIALRRTLGMFTTGVTVITTRAGEQVHGMTANAFMSASLRPPLVLISVDRRAKMCGLLHQGSRYGVSVLAEHQTDLSDRFAGRVDEGHPEPVFELVRETPLVDGALAHFVARVDRSYYAGDHSLFLGHVEFARYREGAPLLFHGGRYERLGGETDQNRAVTPAELLAPLLASGEERSYAAGEAIVTIGERGDELYLILDGTVLAKHPGRPDRMLDAGSYFGEVGALTGEPRIATVVADGDVRCVAVTRESLRETLAEQPGAGWEMLISLAGRVREAP
jgi:flavin reductase (DIM6/NTAB) family NADH-FMN oxidoreductase RutF